MESHICNPRTPDWLTFLGSMLIMLWGGLRWADLQRTCPSSLAMDGHTMRGIAWRSKTSRTGQPFGLWTFGVSARPPQWGWGIAWFLTLARWISSLRTSAGPDVVLDFLLQAVKVGSYCRGL